MILGDIMNQSGCYGIGIAQSEVLGHDEGYGARMFEITLAASPRIFAVCFFGDAVCLLDEFVTRSVLRETLPDA